MSTTALDRVDAIEQVLIGGDLAKLSALERVTFYNRVCASLDLNPLTKPFEYIVLNGKLTLYARKDCTEQLRNKRGISVQIVAREVVEDCYVVTARALMASGRQDESIGAVPIAGLKGEARANALMKAETKAKRRVTLSICGLGLLDETEVESLDRGGYVVEPSPAPTRGLSVREVLPPGEPVPDPVVVPEPDELPTGAVVIVRVDVTPTRNPKVQKAIVTVSTGETYNTVNSRLIALCEQLTQAGTPVVIGTDDFDENQYGLQLRAVHPVTPRPPQDDDEARMAELARQAGEVI